MCDAREEQEPITFLYITQGISIRDAQICRPTESSKTCSDLFPLTNNVYRYLNKTQEILTDRCVLGFVIVPQAFKVLDSSCTMYSCLAWQSNDRENAFFLSFL